MSADIQLSVPHINSKLVVELCTASLKHILFIRELIPQPYETISQTDVSELTCHRPSMRKIEAFANHFASIEDDLRILSSFIDVAEIQFILGPSLTSPKEVYCLHFPKHVVGGGEITEGKERECVRRTIRSYIHHWGEVDCNPLTLTNTFVAIRPHDPTPSLFAEALSNTSCFGFRLFARTGVAGKLKRRPPHHHWFFPSLAPQSGEATVDGIEEHGTSSGPSVCSTGHGGGVDVPEPTESSGVNQLGGSFCAVNQDRVNWLVLKTGLKGLKNIKLSG